MNLSNKWLWWGAGIILIILGLTLKPVSQSSNQVTPPANPTAAPTPVIALPVLPTVAPVGPSMDVTVSASNVSADVLRPIAPTAVTSNSTACPAGQPVPEGASVWLTSDGHAFAGASGRVFPSGVTLTGRQTRDFCETDQSGPFGPEWVQLPY